MDAIEILVNEHKPIKTVLKAIRKVCLDIINGKQIDHQLFFQIIDFVRNFADKYHHQKEETHLFEKMARQANDPPHTGPIMGMLLEHDLGRNYIANLEKAVAAHQAGSEEAKLDIIANAISYEQLLHSHIDKEDNIIYKMGIRELPPEELDRMSILFNEIEEDAENTQIRNKYLNFAERLEHSLQM